MDSPSTSRNLVAYYFYGYSGRLLQHILPQKYRLEQEEGNLPVLNEIQRENFFAMFDQDNASDSDMEGKMTQHVVVSYGHIDFGQGAAAPVARQVPAPSRRIAGLTTTGMAPAQTGVPSIINTGATTPRRGGMAIPVPIQVVQPVAPRVAALPTQVVQPVAPRVPATVATRGTVAPLLSVESVVFPESWKQTAKSCGVWEKAFRKYMQKTQESAKLEHYIGEAEIDTIGTTFRTSKRSDGRVYWDPTLNPVVPGNLMATEGWWLRNMDPVTVMEWLQEILAPPRFALHPGTSALMIFKAAVADAKLFWYFKADLKEEIRSYSLKLNTLAREQKWDTVIPLWPTPDQKEFVKEWFTEFPKLDAQSSTSEPMTLALQNIIRKIINVRGEQNKYKFTSAKEIIEEIVSAATVSADEANLTIASGMIQDQATSKKLKYNEVVKGNKGNNHGGGAQQSHQQKPNNGDQKRGNKRKFGDDSSADNTDNKKVDHKCSVCGNPKHKGGAECNFSVVQHPDRNQSTNKSWAESEKGVAYKNKGFSSLSWTKSPFTSAPLELDFVVDGKRVPRLTYLDSQKGKEKGKDKGKDASKNKKQWKQVEILNQLNSLPCNHIQCNLRCSQCETCEYCFHVDESSYATLMNTNCIPAYVTYRKNKLDVNVLLDTGALGSDYCSERVATWFKSQGALLATNKLTRVCAAFNNCQISSEIITTNIAFKPVNNNDNINDDVFDTLDLSFKVVNKLPCDIILGKKTIAKFNLWHLFGENDVLGEVEKEKLDSNSMKLLSESVDDKVMKVVGDTITELAQVDDNVSKTEGITTSLTSDSKTQLNPEGYVREKKCKRSTTFLPTKVPSQRKTKRKTVNLEDISDDSISDKCSDTVESVASIKGITNCYKRKGTQQKIVRAIEGVLAVDQGVITPVSLPENPNDLVYRPDSVEVNRAHISNYIHYEEDTEGIEFRGVDAPAADWDSSEPLHAFVSASKAGNSPHASASKAGSCDNDVHAETSYIPNNLYGTAQFVEEMKKVCNKYKHVFNTKLNKQHALVPPMHLEVDLEQWQTNKNRGPPRLQTLAKQKEIEKQIRIMLDQQIIRVSQAEEYSQVHMTPKPHQHLEQQIKAIAGHTQVQAEIKWRFCLDYRKQNMASKGIGNNIPNILQMFQRIGSHKPKYFGKIDLTSGYHQAPLAVDSQRFTAFITFMGIFEWLRVPMGLKGAPSYFQGVMATIVLVGLLYTICELYLDDILIHAQTESEFLSRLDQVLKRLSDRKITANPEKVFLGMEEVEFVGHTINKDGLSFSREKIDKVLQIPPPVFGKQLKSFLGVAVYFHDHVENYSSKVRCLHAMLKNYDKTRSQRLIWSDEATVAFEGIKSDINNLPLLYFVDDTSPIFLRTDASDYGIGAYLYQVKDEKEYPIAFMSHALSERERGWDTIQKECYAIVFAFHKFYYILRDRKFVLQTDHKNLIYMDTDTDEKVKRWKMNIQEFDCMVQHIPGKDNVVADGFSRILVLTEEELLHFWSEDDESELTEEQFSALYDFGIPVKNFDMIKSVHNSIAGHHGVERTIEKLEKAGHNWLYRREHVKKFIHECALCQKLSHIRVPIHTHPYTVAAYHPMERLGIDSMGPLPESALGYKYILVVICCFTRWVELFPLKDLASEVTVKALLQHFGRFGNPSQIIHDNGSQFTNEQIAEIVRLTGIEPIPILAYSSEENAMVERANKEIMRHLRAIVFDKNILSNWEEYLPLVQRILNATRSESNAVGPDQLLFGNAIRLDRGIFVPHQAPHDVHVSLSAWAADMLHAQEELMKLARDTQKRRDLEHMLRADIRRTEYPVNSYVLCDYHKNAFRKGPPNKMLTYLRGPMKVISNDRNTYKLENLVTRKIELIHVTDIHPYHYDPNHSEPRDVARRDITSAFEVENILEHTGDVKKRSTLDFLVSWVGYDESENLWLPYSELRDNEVLHAYLLSLGLDNLIPAKFNVPKSKKVGKRPRQAQPVAQQPVAQAASRREGLRNGRRK